MDDAECVLSELVVRCLVLIKLPKFSKAKRRRFESCRLHDLMRDLCLHKAKEENFMRIINDYKDGSKSLFDKFHRLVIDFESESIAVDDQQLLIPKEMMLKHTRMLKVDLRGIEFPEIFRYQFKYLRVLILEKRYPDRFSNSTESKLSRVLGKLIHLRYLSVHCYWVNMLFSSLGNLIHLQTLHLRGGFAMNSSKLISLRNLRELKYLSLPFLERPLFDCDFHGQKCLNPLQLDGLSKLEVLDNYCSSIFDAGELFKLANLHVLTVREECPEINNLERIVDYIYHSDSLRFVSIFIDIISKSNKLPVLLQILLCARSLKELFIDGLPYWFPKYEDILSTSAAGIVVLNITFVHIGKAISNPMETLENLPNLRELSLDQVDIEEMVSHATSFPQLRTLRLKGFQKLQNWNVEKGAFPRLRTLSLSFFHEMRSWIVEQGAMPNLSSLHLEFFDNLNELPEGLKVLKMLEKISYYRVSDSLEKDIEAHLNEDPSKTSQTFPFEIRQINSIF